MDTRVQASRMRLLLTDACITVLLSRWHTSAGVAAPVPCRELQHVNQKARITPRRHRVPITLPG